MTKIQIKITEYPPQVTQAGRYSVTNPDRVKRIDAIWYTKKDVIAEFEVEHSTAITEAIVRGSNIPNDSMMRIMVLPEERYRLLRRKVQEPVLKEQIAKQKWLVLSYDELNAFLAKYKKKQPKLDALRAKMLDLLDFKPQMQESMKKFL